MKTNIFQGGLTNIFRLQNDRWRNGKQWAVPRFSELEFAILDLVTVRLIAITYPSLQQVDTHFDAVLAVEAFCWAETSVRSSASFLAEISVKSPRKLFMFII